MALDCSALKCFILGTKMLSSFKHHDCCKRAFKRALFQWIICQLHPKWESRSLLATNVFQHGSHETHLVFKVVV